MVQSLRATRSASGEQDGAAPAQSSSGGASTIATSGGHSEGAQSYFHGAVSSFQAASAGASGEATFAGPDGGAAPQQNDGIPPPPPPPDGGAAAQHDDTAPPPPAADAHAPAAAAPRNDGVPPPPPADGAAAAQRNDGVPPPPAAAAAPVAADGAGGAAAAGGQAAAPNQVVPPPPPAPPEDEDDGIVLDGAQRANAAAAVAAVPQAPRGPLRFASGGIQMTASGQPLIITNRGGKAIISSPHTDITATIQVTGGTAQEALQYDVGFIQTVLGVERKFHYSGKPAGKRYRLHSIPGDTRDAHEGIPAPWYDHQRKVVDDTDKAFNVKMDDGPEARLDWDTGSPQLNDVQRLRESEGKDRFCSWIIARPRKGGDIIYIAWAEWEVDWGATYDAKAKTGQPTSGKLKTVGTGLGMGAHAPNLDGAPANKFPAGSWVPE
ncbi:MAG: hypothetical protein U1F43_27895 [Myxococcota bacterium]